ncbi:MAG: cobalt-precorrin-5B (C(1))-methyltransferase [Methanomassiliicoccales archaeon]|nr:MAG: cobalt-precorrin-5B (C(1))-methyltransferase [Methanomassiliicoccales archaeon]
MKDPVSGFEYPEEWVSRCKDDEALADVKRGLAVLLSDGSVKLRGFTTGTTAAAACKAAVLSTTKDVDMVDVKLACSLRFEVPAIGWKGTGICAKFPGDYPEDATANLLFRARFEGPSNEVMLETGTGIGRWDRDTPRFKKGEPAISHSARTCIINAISEACEAIGMRGAKVHLEVPEGEVRAERTLNPRMGIIGGISVLGSTGLVEPWDDHLGQDAMARVAQGGDVVITTGRVGLRFARMAFPGSEVVLVGANISEAFAAASGRLTLYGLPALIMKFIEPDVLEGTGFMTVEELVCSERGHVAIRKALARFKEVHPGHRVVIIDRDGRVMGDSG